MASSVPRATTSSSSESAVPTLRVMRLQSPEMHRTKGAVPMHECSLQTSLCLPDSLAVYVGEQFTAYLGILNTSGNSSSPIRRLTVTAQLQTPSQRFQLPSRLDAGNVAGGMDVESGVDTIVSRTIEEPGQHILRVEVSYQQNTSDGGSGTKTFRKFYRFQVQAPLKMSTTVVRTGDAQCFVSVKVEYTAIEKEKQDAIVITSTGLETATGLTGTSIGTTSLFATTKDDNKSSTPPTAVELFDNAGSMVPGGSFSFIFNVETTSKEATLRGIAAGDYLGRAVFCWRKAMGETGTVSSEPIHCPRAEPVFDQRKTASGNDRWTCSNFVTHRSGLSVDVAAASAAGAPLAAQFPVTVEPIDPPSNMTLNVPVAVQFLVVNHSDQPLPLQLQLNLQHMESIVVCGRSFQNLGQVQQNGGSTVATVQLMALQAGLVKVDGCTVVDLASGREIHQPPLFSVFVDRESGGSE